MFKNFKRNFAEFRGKPPGKRFLAYYQHRHDPNSSQTKRMLVLAGAGLLILLGLIMMPAPGPGLLVVAAGAALMAGESAAVARALDRGELAIRALISGLRR